MLRRTIETYLKQVTKKYPVIAITGPRQSGKTTLVAKLYKSKAYVSLEDLDQREYATSDPRGFLAQYPNGCVIDEAQYVPQLFSYIQTRVDQSKTPGEFVLTGSQNFSLIEKITQSLAGRVALSHLLPLSYDELGVHQRDVKGLSDLLFTGLYPRIYDQELNPTEWLKNYTRTYIERDVRQLLNISNLSKFQIFLGLCAGRTGQLLNISSLASDCGIDQKTAKSWLTILEASFIIFFLKPHHKNFNKRLVKQPKLYFYDTGLACYLLGLETAKSVDTHHLRGALFENYVINELIKKRSNAGKDSNLYFWRDNHGHEVDILFSKGEDLIPIEVKAGKTLANDFFDGLQEFTQLAGSPNGFLVFGGDTTSTRKGINVLPWTKVSKIPV